MVFGALQQYPYLGPIAVSRVSDSGQVPVAAEYDYGSMAIHGRICRCTRTICTSMLQLVKYGEDINRLCCTWVVHMAADSIINLNFLLFVSKK